MTSTTTTTSETQPPSESIRLAAAYDDKTHEGVSNLTSLSLMLFRADPDFLISTNTRNTYQSTTKPRRSLRPNPLSSMIAGSMRTGRNPTC